MALAAVIDDLDGVPEAVREHYRKNEESGKYVLDVQAVGGLALEDVGGLKTALGKERKSREDATKLLKAFEGLDPEEARTAIQKVAEFSELDPKKEADKIAAQKVEAIKSQLTAKHDEEIKVERDKVGKLTSHVEKLLIDNAATQAITEAKGSLKLLLPHVRSAVRLKTDDDGSFAVEVVDGEGNPKIADAQGRPMTIKDLVGEMRQSEEFARAFDGTGTGGSGTPPNGGGGGPAMTKKASEMTVDEKSSFIAKHGLSKWREHVGATSGEA